MSLSTAALNLAANGIAGAVTQLSLHSGDPGSSGTSNELSGGNYTRENASYNPASGGTADLSASVEFGGPASSTQVQYLGFWASGPTFLGSVALSSAKTLTSDDTLTITAAPITAS